MHAARGQLKVRCCFYSPTPPSTHCPALLVIKPGAEKARVPPGGAGEAQQGPLPPSLPASGLGRGWEGHEGTGSSGTDLSLLGGRNGRGAARRRRGPTEGRAEGSRLHTATPVRRESLEIRHGNSWRGSFKERTSTWWLGSPGEWRSL